MPNNDPEGEREVDEEKAKERTEKMLADPKFKRPKGHKDDEATRDDDLSDPALQEED